jgi:hypothetical protein
MRYLGAMRGAGMLASEEQTFSRADYDFDVFATGPDQVSASGEIRMSPEGLRKVFGRRHLQLRTDDGKRLVLRFTEKRLPSEETATHVDVTEGLPPAAAWRKRA